ncbi:ribosome small subunit-dependent GTPase A [Leptolyngbya cf. ectocarpi LEGE 11479]|uniref:Small ribosomal subunit biogenesis GTPase RsgA n=1 Tax=Leptolyngbya cf. ectocarpi LEGE 11479 TaxID=1828722 RepID=A0A928ZX93_LEPEC|nr:ribosome small subunit-dependent GTPase A [Leptolyngbya ectocarpi]MBE9069134.1 ribosome small subunit-dependent GTPase A [Leptolyngbya cf. ectocarpi LEGE 11479]
MELTSLGWSDTFAHSFAPYAAQGYSVGRIAVVHRSQYHLYTEQGDMTATLTGKFRHQTQNPADFPAVGDWVVLQTQPETDQTLIEAVLPRKSQFSRQAAGTRTAAQVVAANIDTLFLVSGLDHDFNLRRIERYLVMAWESGAEPVIVLNKADLCEDLDQRRIAVEAVAFGVPIILLSALQQTNLEALAIYLKPGQTIALLGSSGVGKSTLVNQLMGVDIQTTQAVRADDSHGRHTTTSRTMLRLPTGTLLIDTPGMRELQLWLTDDSLDETFTDIEMLAQQCRFRDCQHQSEPGCAIQAALATGELSAKRLSNYQKLQKEQAYLHRRQDHQTNSKARWKAITKTIRQQQKREE